MTFTEFDQLMMRRALDLAERGMYSTHPNPRVGCVIVQGQRIVGEGWHRKWGEPHAEPIALAAAGDAAKGATVYVTLEPHSYHGRTPPCTDALIRAGVKRVICGAMETNPQVAGRGLEQLRAAGLDAEYGLLEAEARALNKGFDHRMRTGKPRVVVKIAASIDGRIALATGESRWITGEAARADVQRLRAQSSAVLTGIETVIADDPQLTVRDPTLDLAGRVPMRVVLDSTLRMSASARMLSEPGETLIFTSKRADAQRATALESAGAKVLRVDESSVGRLDWASVLTQLGERMCNDVLVEAGPTIAGDLLAASVIDELIVYIAPKVLGPRAKPMIAINELTSLSDAPRFECITTERIGDDVKLTFEPRR